jgi:hypothetical protein
LDIVSWFIELDEHGKAICNPSLDTSVNGTSHVPINSAWDAAASLDTSVNSTSVENVVFTV